jgi:Flp pilus assembly protein TadG
VFVCLLLVGLLGMGAIVLDGGRGYSMRRSMQNAADAAATAGTSALDRYRFSGATDAGAVKDAVQREVRAQGGDRFTCALTDWSGTTTVAPDCEPGTVQLKGNGASGVRVQVSDSEATFLGGVVGQRSSSVNTTATASIQIVNATGSAPFIICGKKVDPRSGPNAYDLLRADNSLNVDQVKLDGYQTGGTRRFGLQGSAVPDCGAGSSFDGKSSALSNSIVPGVACPGFNPSQLPSTPPPNCEWAKGDNGNGTLAAPNTLEAITTTKPCTSALLAQMGAECDTFLPVADYGAKSGSTAYLHVVTWLPVRVRVESGGNPRFSGSINLDASQVTSGPSTGGNAGTGMTRAVKLVA